jgi:chemotaxis protein methyltransferase CheR
VSDAPSAANAPIALSPEELAAVSTLLDRWTGRIFGENKRYYIEHLYLLNIEINVNHYLKR